MALALVLALFSSCARKGKVIPRARMSKIYAEMLMTDQWISTHRKYNRQADTCFVYGTILEKYGYTADDWRASVAHYLHDPQRYGRMLNQTESILKSIQARLTEEESARNAAKEYLAGLAKFEPEKIYILSGLTNPETFYVAGQKYYVDTNGGDWRFDPTKGADTIYKGPVLIWPEPIDSVKFRADSIALADSLAKIDSLARLDSIARLDSLSVKDAPVSVVEPSEVEIESNPIKPKDATLPKRTRVRNRFEELEKTANQSVSDEVIVP